MRLLLSYTIFRLLSSKKPTHSVSLCFLRLIYTFSTQTYQSAISFQLKFLSCKGIKLYLSVYSWKYGSEVFTLNQKIQRRKQKQASTQEQVGFCSLRKGSVHIVLDIRISVCKSSTLGNEIRKLFLIKILQYGFWFASTLPLFFSEAKAEPAIAPQPLTEQHLVTACVNQGNYALQRRKEAPDRWQYLVSSAVYEDGSFFICVNR